ncbi:MAG: cation:proton antiporter [Gemmatimonadota bacterium]|nr:cation:proton antiporter [Gemmatimonadota bacterium]
MKLLFAAVALGLLSILGSRFAFRSRRASLGMRLLFSSGLPFVLAGLLLGPHGTGLLGPAVLPSFSPFIVLGLGWIGLSFGLQFEPRAFAAFRPRAPAVAFGQAGIAWLVLAGGLAALFGRPGGPDSGAFPAAIAAAAAGSASSPTGVAVVFGSARVRGPLSHIIRLASSLDAAVGITCLAVLYAAIHVTAAPAYVEVGLLRWLLAPLLLAVFLGWLFLSLTREKPPGGESLLFLLGLALVLAGTSLSLSASALFAASLAGMFLAVLSPQRRRVQEMLTAWEKPVHVVFLVLAGSLLEFGSWHVAVLLGAYLLLRVAGKTAGGRLAGSLGDPGGSGGSLGLALLPQGGVSIAMAVSSLLVLRQRFPHSALVPAFFDAVVLGVIAGEIAGPLVMRSVLRGAGEIDAGVA